MNLLWNKKNLERPANNIWASSREAIDFEKFVSTLKTVIQDLKSQNLLHTEATILSRLIYRMKMKFRNDKGLKNMEKVNRALLNYLEIQLLKEYKNLKNYVEVDGLVVNLPTKQMVEYVLVRTQGFAKLMCRIESLSKCAAEFFMNRLIIGHAWTMAVVAYAVMSRIWYLSRYLLKRCCAWYNGVFQYVSRFKAIGPTWLPKNYNLPSNLKTWLDLPWIDHVTDSVPLQKDGERTIFSLLKAQIKDSGDSNSESEDSDESNNDSSDDVQELSMTDQEIPPAKHELRTGEPLSVTDDIGTAVNRETFQSKLREEVPDTQEPIERRANLKRKKDEVSNENKSESSDDESDLAVPIKKRKNTFLTTGERGSAVQNKAKRQRTQATIEPFQSLVSKQVLGLKSIYDGIVKESSEISTTSSHPGKKKKDLPLVDVKAMNKSQRKALKNWIKKCSTSLEECNSDRKMHKRLLCRLDRQIQRFIRVDEEDFPNCSIASTSK